MALLSPAMQDHARRVRSIRSGEPVEGRTPTQKVSEEWQPARLITAPAAEVTDDARKKVVERATLIVGDADVLGSDSYEVDSRTVGLGVWKVAGAPQVILTRRMGRRSIVPVERTVESAYSEATGP